MKKYFVYILFTFFFLNHANASYEGYGPIKLNPTVLKYFKKYLDARTVQNKNMGAEKFGKGWFFFVEENGEEFGYTYCPQGKQCDRSPQQARRACIKNVKKYLKRKGKCKLFAKQRNIVWDNKRLKIPNNATDKEIESILRDYNFID